MKKSEKNKRYSINFLFAFQLLYIGQTIDTIEKSREKCTITMVACNYVDNAI